MLPTKSVWSVSRLFWHVEINFHLRNLYSVENQSKVIENIELLVSDRSKEKLLLTDKVVK